MNSADFVTRFSGIYEHSSWVAERAQAHLEPDCAPGDIARVMADCVDNASPDSQLALIRAHPDLAGKAQVARDLTVDSETEQTSAGLDRCTPDEVEKFQTLNGQYKEKFGFPFVMAVRDSNRHEILAAFKSRLSNELQTEFETAIREIHKIASLRLRELKA